MVHILSAHGDDECSNCEQVDVLTTVGFTSPFAEVKELGERVKSGYEAYHVKFPCIVNTKEIGAGEQVILKWSNEKKRKRS